MNRGLDIRWLLMAGLAIFFGIVIFFNIRQKSQPSYTVKRTDKDTGEVIISEPNKTPETFGQAVQPILLGSEQLINAGMTQDQFLLAKQAILDFSKKNLDNKYSILKILPKGFTAAGGSITADLKLGDNGNTTVPLKITFSALKYVQVIVDSSEAKYRYDSGVLQVAVPADEDGGYTGDGTPPN